MIECEVIIFDTEIQPAEKPVAIRAPGFDNSIKA